MASSLEVSPGAAGRLARTLLTALALSACGGGDEGPPETGQAAPPAGVARVADTTQSACTPPPAVDDAVLTGTWAGFADWRTTNGVAFRNTSPDSTRAQVLLCNDGCVPVTLTIVSEGRTQCLPPDGVAAQTRVAGLWVVDEGTVTPPNWKRTFRPGDSIFVFARDTSAVLAFPGERGTPAADSVRLAPDGAWRFYYCQDGHHNTDPQGKWRSAPVSVPSSVPASATGETEGTYGWMACASGCCQFYSTPPGPGDRARERARGRVPDALPASGRVWPPCP